MSLTLFTDCMVVFVLAHFSQTLLRWLLFKTFLESINPYLCDLIYRYSLGGLYVSVVSTFKQGLYKNDILSLTTCETDRNMDDCRLVSRGPCSNFGFSFEKINFQIATYF